MSMSDQPEAVPPVDPLVGTTVPAAGLFGSNTGIVEVVVLEEGLDMPDFWDGVGGKGRYLTGVIGPSAPVGTISSGTFASFVWKVFEPELMICRRPFFGSAC